MLNIIPGRYEGGLEIFYEDCPLYMDNIEVMVDRVDNNYRLIYDSKVKLSVEQIYLNIISIEKIEDEHDAIYVDIEENQCYKCREVGAFKNVIYINNDAIDDMAKSNVEIRLSLISLGQDNIKNIFIRVKKYL